MIAQGWPQLRDLADIAHLAASPANKQEFQDEIRRRVARIDGPDSVEMRRAPRALWNLLQVRVGDLLVALEGTVVRGIGQASFDSWQTYSFDRTHHYAQTACHPIEWIDWSDALGIRPTAPGKGVLGLASIQKHLSRVLQAWERVEARTR